MGSLHPTKAGFPLQDPVSLPFAPQAQVVLSPASCPLCPSLKAETMRRFPFFLHPHPQVQRSVLQELKRLFSVNGGWGLGVDVTSQMLAFSILRILAGEEELRWYVGTRVSLYAQNNMSSGGGTVTSCGNQWETGSLFPRPTGRQQWYHPGPSVVG